MNYWDPWVGPTLLCRVVRPPPRERSGNEVGWSSQATTSPLIYGPGFTVDTQGIMMLVVGNRVRVWNRC